MRINYLILTLTWTCKDLRMGYEESKQQFKILGIYTAKCCVWLFETPQTVARQASLSKDFSRQEYWSVVTFPSLGDLPDPGIKPTSPVSPALAGRFFTSRVTWILTYHKARVTETVWCRHVVRHFCRQKC